VTTSNSETATATHEWTIESSSNGVTIMRRHVHGDGHKIQMAEGEHTTDDNVRIMYTRDAILQFSDSYVLLYIWFNFCIFLFADHL
jgi:hypothetical protein